MAKKQQQKTAPKLSNVFGDDDASDEDDGTDWVRKALKAEGEKNRMKKQTKLDIQKALNEDPTIYQYDEVYDTMEHSKSKVDINKHKDKKPRYIENLLKTAERRKKEQEHRIERMVQKEREAEGDMYADKGSFVTSAYRAKLEEFKKMKEEEDEMSRLEAIGDVTKQQDMSGFYRHLYEQTVNHQDQSNNESSKTKEKNTETGEQNILANNTNKGKEDVPINETTSERLIATAKHRKPRQYRQRAIETYESDPESETSKEELQKNQTITPSMNKDSDKLEIQQPEKKKRKHDVNDVETDKYTTDTKNKDSSTKDDKISQDSKQIVAENEKVVTERKVVNKEDKSSIWEKRTIGPVFETALQRYYARKATRLAAI